MFIDKFINNGKPYLRLVNSVRIENSKGKKVSQKKSLLNLGPLDKYDDGKDNYLERLRKSFRVSQPLITELEPYCLQIQSLEQYPNHLQEGDDACFGHPKIFSHVLLERIIEELGLRNFFATYKSFTKLKYDVYGFLKILIFGRILNPLSKIATVRQNNDYYSPILKNFNPDNVYDTLTFIFLNKDKIIRRMNTNLVKKSNRNPEVIFYDVTNFYYEIEHPDNDIIDENGDVIEIGIRKNGVCKEERKLPIVQMGLFMDDKGLPIAVETFPGNTLDHLTLRKALEKNIDDAGYARFILIADRGICNYPNLLHATDNGNGYIMAKSLLKSNKEEKDWAYSDKDFIIENNDFKHKSRTVRKKIKDENNQERYITEKVVVYWSRKFEQKSLAENKLFLEFLDKFMESPSNFRITATQAKSLRRFFDKKILNNKTGELINSSELKSLINPKKIEEYKRSFGYYQLVTSELNMDNKDIVDKYHGLSRIEEQFRIMKGTLGTRPLNVRTKEHIEAHLLICMIALLIMRIIQNKIVSSGVVTNNKDVSWSSGMSSYRIQEALKKWQVDWQPGDYYKFMNIDEGDLKLIIKAFDVHIPKKLFRRTELKNIKTNIKNFM